LKEPRTVRLRASRQRCTVIARTGGHRPRFLVRIRPSKVAAFGGHSFGARVSRYASANRKVLRHVRTNLMISLSRSRRLVDVAPSAFCPQASRNIPQHPKRTFCTGPAPSQSGRVAPANR